MPKNCLFQKGFSNCEHYLIPKLDWTDWNKKVLMNTEFIVHRNGFTTRPTSRITAFGFGKGILETWFASQETTYSYIFAILLTCACLAQHGWIVTTEHPYHFIFSVYTIFDYQLLKQWMERTVDRGKVRLCEERKICGKFWQEFEICLITKTPWDLNHIHKIFYSNNILKLENLSVDSSVWCSRDSSLHISANLGSRKELRLVNTGTALPPYPHKNIIQRFNLPCSLFLPIQRLPIKETNLNQLEERSSI